MLSLRGNFISNSKVLKMIRSNKIEIPKEVTAYNHPCKGCGECCSEFLPVTRIEIQVIKQYIAKNGIQPVYQPVMCPFLDLDTKLCKVYPVRPYICRKYDCRKHESKELFNDFDDNWANNVEIVDMAEKFLKDDKTYQEQSEIINKALKIGML